MEAGVCLVELSDAETGVRGLERASRKGELVFQAGDLVARELGSRWTGPALGGWLDIDGEIAGVDGVAWRGPW